MHLAPHPPPRAASTTPPAAPLAAWTPIFLAWLIAAVSTLGALFLSEVVGVPPCVLCWYQRVFMFPLAIVLAVGLFPFDARVLRYAAPLAIGGWLVALYHVLLVAGIVPENLAPCAQGVPCKQENAVWFGFVTIPLMSLVSFSVIGAALIWARAKIRP
jgi:disulfide bond formation protein DsbB